MLAELNIRNFAIIDELKVDFDRGLTVISGETGAGKSIIVGAVGLLLGDRASAEMIRSFEDTAVVEALFDIGDQPDLRTRVREMGFGEGDELVIRRIISRSGKNRIYINGNIAPLAALAAIGESLINVCGQHEHQRLLSPAYQRALLDEWGKEEISAPLGAYRACLSAANDASAGMLMRSRLSAVCDTCTGVP